MLVFLIETECLSVGTQILFIHVWHECGSSDTALMTATSAETEMQWRDGKKVEFGVVHSIRLILLADDWIGKVSISM